jgi:hypothetical protein
VQLLSPSAQLGGFLFRFGRLGKSLNRPLRLLLIRRHPRNGARKSGGPTPFELSLKVQRDFAHNPPSGFEVLPRCYDLNVHEARKVHLTRRREESAAAGLCDGPGRLYRPSARVKPAPAAFRESGRGHSITRPKRANGTNVTVRRYG